ncbi:MAG: hydantoinase/oxoprolinase N-terminal domain-containing protein, partial [Gemmatimonadota bacterium]
MEGGLRIGIDVGGTFTDLVAIDGTGPLRRCKVFSTPEDPSRAVLAGLEQLLGATATDAGGAESADAGRSDRLWAGASIVHGSTIATNAVLERKGARTAFVATRGFRDLLTLGRQDRPDLFDFESRRPEPLASEELCFELSGRVDPAGVELEPLDEGDLPELIGRLRSGGAESVAICLLFSFARPEHEVSVGRALREAGFHVSLSSEVLPEFREYERASTTALNAYVGPILDRYLGRLEERLPSG